MRPTGCLDRGEGLCEMNFRPAELAKAFDLELAVAVEPVMAVSADR